MNGINSIVVSSAAWLLRTSASYIRCATRSSAYNAIATMHHTHIIVSRGSYVPHPCSW